MDWEVQGCTAIVKCCRKGNSIHYFSCAIYRQDLERKSRKSNFSLELHKLTKQDFQREERVC